MFRSHEMKPAGLDDSTLVAECLSGNRDAFGEIVGRYQSLVCSVAYSATGSVAQSEDLAQETFITAWKELSKLSDRSKLRPWLCGIARNLVGKKLRNEGREPVSLADSLEHAAETPTSDPLPVQQTISAEEEALLWRAMESIPMLYREPLVLYYREQQSIEAVAEALELTEETVRQRLSRGRRMVSDQLQSFVERTLSRSGPNQAFTVGVLAALPLATTIKASGATVFGTAATKSATTKSILAAASGGALLSAFPFVSHLAFCMFLGSCVGCLMGLTVRWSARQMEAVTRFWRGIALSYLMFLAIPELLNTSEPTGSAFQWRLWCFESFIYCAIPVLLTVWLWRWKRFFHTPETSDPSPATRKRLYGWLGLGLIGPAWLVVSYIKVLFWPATAAVARNIDRTHSLPAIDVRLAAFFVAGIGITLLALIARRRAQYSHAATAHFLETAERVRARSIRIAMNLFRTMGAAVGVALLVWAAALGYATRWHTQSMNPDQLPAMIEGHKLGQFEIFQYRDGTRELNLRPRDWHVGPLVFPADDQTETLLRTKQIPFNTRVQGRDFGFKMPGPRMAGLLMTVGIALGIAILGWAARGTLFRTPAFVGTFLCISLSFYGSTLWHEAFAAKYNVSVARIQVNSWSQPGNPKAESELFFSEAVADPMVRSLNLVEVLEKAYHLAPTQRPSEVDTVRCLALTTIFDFYTNSAPGFIDLQFASTRLESNQVANIANGLAQAYCDYRKHSTSNAARVLIAASPSVKPISDAFPPELLLRRVIIGVAAGLCAGLLAAWLVQKRARKSV